MAESITELCRAVADNPAGYNNAFNIGELSHEYLDGIAKLPPHMPFDNLVKAIHEQPDAPIVKCLLYQRLVVHQVTLA